jgi:hypothetical protein
VFSTDELYSFGGEVGARSLGLEEWDAIDVDLGHRSLASVEHDHVPAALLAGCGCEVVVSAA